MGTEAQQGEKVLEYLLAISANSAKLGAIFIQESRSGKARKPSKPVVSANVTAMEKNVLAKWSATEVKNNLGAFLEAVFFAPVEIVRHGRTIAVTVTAREYEHLKRIESLYLRKTAEEDVDKTKPYNLDDLG